MAAVALIVASRALKVLHLAVDGLAADDVQYLPALQGMQSTSAWSHTLKAEPYTDSAHGWGSTFYGVSAAKHCEYSSELRGCTGIPTLDAWLGTKGITSKGYRTVKQELPWFEPYFQSFVYSATAPAPTETDEYAVWYHDSLDHIRHLYGVHNQHALEELDRIDALVTEVLGTTEWDIIVISSDHGWKHCSNGINVKCALHSGAMLTEVNTPLYVQDKRDSEGSPVVAVGQLSAPLSHSDIAPAIVTWFGQDLPCAWGVGIRNCTNTQWPGNQKDVLTKTDEANLLIDGLIGTTACIMVASGPLLSRWLLEQ